ERREAEADRAARRARTTQVELAAARQRLARLRQVEAMDEPIIAARLVQVYKQGRGGFARLFLGAETLQDMGRAARTISSLVDQNAARVAARLLDIAAAARLEEELEVRLV